ncbi:MAG TPA: phospholipid carrier-dependent glycosyltransferase [Isosphaeraceae bacterium]|nr:phospholipid carrier-dependent glycosyltransferase [Isosphaeraceae bacterium]
MSDSLGKPEAKPPRPWTTWLCAGLVGALAVAVFGHDLGSEPHFADESAYISQSYFADLLLVGQWNSPAWLTYPARDLPPLPKYLIGGALKLRGYPLPGPSAARAWYMDINARCETDEMLEVARRPMVILGAAGCVAIFALGTMVGGRRVGVLAALLLMVNPLYKMQARRAMSDVPAEAFILASAAVFLWAWQRAIARERIQPPWLAAAAIVSGVFAGLATLSKLNGALALLIIAAWVVLTASLPRVAIRAKIAIGVAAMVTGIAAALTFFELNPYLTAQLEVRRLGGNQPIAQIAAMSPWGRARAMLELRLNVPLDQQKVFPNYALTSPTAKIEAVVVQGFGRFGPFGPAHSDSTKRFDWNQDRGALIWLPWVVLGAIWAASRGRRQFRAGEPTTSWAILLQAIVALATVTAFIPLAWDRYYLSLQPGSALFAAGVAVAALDSLVGRILRQRGA